MILTKQKVNKGPNEKSPVTQIVIFDVLLLKSSRDSSQTHIWQVKVFNVNISSTFYETNKANFKQNKNA